MIPGERKRFEKAAHEDIKPKRGFGPAGSCECLSDTEKDIMLGALLAYIDYLKPLEEVSRRHLEASSLRQVEELMFQINKLRDDIAEMPICRPPSGVEPTW